MDSSATFRSNFILPVLSLFVVSTPTSSAFRARLASPSQISAKNPIASSVASTFREPKPLSLSLNAALRIFAISSRPRRLNSNMPDLESKGEFIEKNGLCVVVPIRIGLPPSTSGISTSCWALLNL